MPAVYIKYFSFSKKKFKVRKQNLVGQKENENKKEKRERKEKSEKRERSKKLKISVRYQNFGLRYIKKILVSICN